jgi:hypothetical protein
MNIKIAAATVLVALSLTGCGAASSNTTTEPDISKGDPKVHARINAEKDCTKLAEELDLASKNADRNIENGKYELAKASGEYMITIGKRQDELKCFG